MARQGYPQDGVGKLAPMARALWFDGPRSVVVRTEPSRPVEDGEVRVRTSFSGISGGTEMLAYRGELDPALPVDETIGALGGTFTFPFRYGYSCVGVVEESRCGLDRGRGRVRLPAPSGLLRGPGERPGGGRLGRAAAGDAVPARRDGAADHAGRRPPPGRDGRGPRARCGRRPHVFDVATSGRARCRGRASRLATVRRGRPRRDGGRPGGPVVDAPAPKAGRGWCLWSSTPRRARTPSGTR